MRSAVSLYKTYVGRKALLTVCNASENKTHGTPGTPGIEVPVFIVDARVMFKREDLLVTPYCGVGSGWVGASKITIVEEFPNESIEIQGTPPPGADEQATLDPDDVEPPA